ncbi:MAG: adenosylhomocysteinase, partial [Caldimicrobium sp.]
ISRKRRLIRDYVEEFTLKSGRRLYLLGEGRLINLAAAEGHPSAVMDMSFANQALSVEYLVKNAKRLDNTVFRVPEEIDREIARLKLKALGIDIDRLTTEQKKYLKSWQMGT